MPTNKRKIQEINAGSMADISFLLLIFFLVATTMNVDTGISRILPPMPENDQKLKDQDVKERNLMNVFVNKFDQIMIVGKGQIDIFQLKDEVKNFITNRFDEENLPEKENTEIEMPDGSKWVYPVSKGVISLQNDRGTSYNMYIMVQNELTRAFNEVRDEAAMQKFGVVFSDLSEEQRGVIQKAVPLKISEAEPRNVEGGR